MRRAIHRSIWRGIWLGFIWSVLATPLAVAGDYFSSSSSSESPKFGTWLGYGVGFPQSYGGGVSFFRFFNAGIVGTTHSTAFTLGVNARAVDAIISPLFGLNVNWYSIRAGDINVPGYSDGVNGPRLTMNAGIGIQPFPGFMIDGGITYMRNDGGTFQPYVQVSWPIKLNLN